MTASTDSNASSSSSDLSGVLRRVSKLLAIAGDARADANEAAAAASQAQKIMRKYQLDNSDLIQAELKAGGGAMKFRAVFANMKRDDPKRTPAVTNPSWGQFLAVAIARLYDCEVRQGKDVNKFGLTVASLRFYGYHADVEICAYTFDYLVSVLIRALAQRQKTVTNDRLASESYRKGFVLTLTQRLADVQREKDAAPGRGLVVLKKQAISEEFGQFGYKARPAAQVRSREDFLAGAMDARQVDLQRRGLTAEDAGQGALRLN